MRLVGPKSPQSPHIRGGSSGPLRRRRQSPARAAILGKGGGLLYPPLQPCNCATPESAAGDAAVTARYYARYIE
jgi:hypothetical protein